MQQDVDNKTKAFHILLNEQKNIFKQISCIDKFHVDHINLQKTYFLRLNDTVLINKI